MKAPRASGLLPTYIPSLDGWRAIAVVCVMLLHDRLHRLGPVSDSWMNEHGTIGVNVFFAISGILICSRLLDEESRNGRISLRSFYIRRAFRILPPALLFLLVVAVMIATGHTDATWQRWFSALFFCRNFFPLLDPHAKSWLVAHYWSLSLEEQFYFIFPALLVFGRRWRTSILVTIIVAGFIWSGYLAHHDISIPLYRPDIALNVLFVPALAAILLRRRNYGKWIATITRPWPIYLILIFLTQSPELMLRRGLAYHGHFFHQSLAFLMTALVLSTALHPNIWLSRFLELAPLRWVGRISYSLYLWQQLFMTQHIAPAETIGWVYRHGLDWPLTFLCAALSYYLLERPFIRLGHRFTRNPVPGRPGDFDPPAHTLQPASV